MESYRERNKGDFPLEEFECKVPSRIYGSPRVLLEDVNDGEYVNAIAYSTDSELFRRDLVEEKRALPQLEVVGRGQSKLRTLKFEAPVKQVLNLFSKQKSSRRDAFYVLTCDDKIIRFKTTELMDSSIDDDSLTRVVVYEDKPEDDDDIDEIGDIECFTARLDTVLFIMRDQDEMFIIKDNNSP